MSIQDIGSLSVASIGGASILPDLDNVSLSLEDETQRNDSITRGGQAVQTVKRKLTFAYSLFSSLASPDPERVSHLHLTALTLGGTDILPDLESMNFDISYEQKEKPSAGALWAYPQNVTKKVSGTIKIGMPATGGAGMIVDQFSSTLATQTKSLSFVLNGVTVTLPVRVTGWSQPFERDGLYIYELKFEGRDPGTGAFPSAPTGTTTMLELALNLFKTAVAVAFTSHATEGYAITGNAVFGGFSFEVQDKQLVTTKITLNSQSTMAAVAN